MAQQPIIQAFLVEPMFAFSVGELWDLILKVALLLVIRILLARKYRIEAYNTIKLGFSFGSNELPITNS
jgi:hypothetical protein